MQDNDILLVKECQAGDKSAYDKLVQRYKRQIYQLAFQLSGSHYHAHEISQETFIQLYHSIKKFKGKSKFSTWLHRLTINFSINYLKKESRYEHTHLEEEIIADNDRSPIQRLVNNPVDEVEANELAQNIIKAMESLPLKEKIVLVLRNQQGLSYKEIAKTINCPIGTVMSRLNGARRRLRDQLKDYVV
jgi:RNA polymerase sigma-70 factor (ECF subfamily)